MKHLFKMFLSILLATNAQAVTVKGQLDTGAHKEALRIEAPANQFTKTGDKQFLIETGNDNLLKNPDFQSGVPGEGWVVNTAQAGISNVNFRLKGKQSLRQNFQDAIFTEVDMISQTWTSTGEILTGQEMVAGFSLAPDLRSTVAAKVCLDINSVQKECISLPNNADPVFKDYMIKFKGAGDGVSYRLYLRASSSAEFGMESGINYGGAYFGKAKQPEVNSQTKFEYINENNFVKNPFAANGLSEVTCVGATKNRVEGANKFKGISAHTITSATAGGYCEYGVRTPTAPYDGSVQGQRCIAMAYYGGGNMSEFDFMVNGVPNALENVTSGYKYSYVDMPCTATAPTLRIQRRATGTSYTGEVFMYYGPSDKTFTGSDSSATLVGSIKWAGATNCVWGTTSGSYANFVADSDCSNPTVTGIVRAPGTKIPGFGLPAIKEGTYKFVANGSFQQNGGNGVLHGFRFSDGANNTTPNTLAVSSSGGLATGNISGQLTYAAPAGATTVQIQGVTSGTDTTIISASFADLQIDVYYYPPASKATVATLDQLDTVLKSAGTLTVGATTTAPTKGSTIVNDRWQVGRQSDQGIFKLDYLHTAAGGLGSGDYLYTLPNGLKFDSSKVVYSTLGVGGAGVPSPSAFGSARVYFGTQVAPFIGQIVPYDQTRFRLCGLYVVSATNVPYAVCMGSSNLGFSSATLSIALDFTAPIEQYATPAPPGVIKIDPPVYIPFDITTTGAGTLSVPNGTSQIIFDKIIGGGAGGSSSATALGGVTLGTNGGDTTIGGTLFVAGGGKVGTAGQSVGGVGGTYSISAGVSGVGTNGSGGAGGFGSTGAYWPSAAGGTSCSTGSGVYSVATAANSGAGGAGANGPVSGATGGGGGGGACIEQGRISNPASSYAINVGAGGSGATAPGGGVAGFAGSAGRISGRFVFSSLEAALFSGALARVPGAVVSKNISSLNMRVEAFDFTGGAALTSCTASPCTIRNTSNPGGIVVTRSALGVYPIVFSQAWKTNEYSCNVTMKNFVGSNISGCYFQPATTTTGTFTCGYNNVVNDVSASVYCWENQTP